MPTIAPAPISSKSRYRVATTSELPPGQRKIIQAGRFKVGVFNVNGKYRAVLNMCPHELAPVCEGHLRGTTAPTKKPGEYQWGREGEILLCPWHGWEFNLHDGKSLHDAKCHLKTFEVVVEEETVYVLA